MSIEYGNVIVTRHSNEAGTYITLETPLPQHTLVHDEFLTEIRDADHGAVKWAYLYPPIEPNPVVLLHRLGHERHDVDCTVKGACWYGWYLHLLGRNITAIYRIDEMTHSNSWAATRV